MSTPNTLLIRCGMRDLISCFNLRSVLTKEDLAESVHQKPKPSSNDDNIRNRKREKEVKLVGTTNDKGFGGCGHESPTSWQSCDSEEDGYIDFYFEDDDVGVDVIEEIRLECSSCRKQGEDGDNLRKIHEIHEIQVDSKLIAYENESEKHKDTLGESSSDSSTSSFAFPRIQRQWTGSPVLMPRPGGHKKTRSVCVQCCKI